MRSSALTLVAVARADFLERVRRPGYLVTLGVMVWAANLFLPPNPSRYATFHLSGYRGVYNSHWVGIVSAVLASVFLGFAGFYLVKNAVERDRRTGVGAIVAATRVPAPVYLFGKFLSNLAALAGMLLVLAVAAAIVQLVRGEDRHVDPLAILSPLLLVSLPMLALSAATAVVFETIPWLRGGFGNVVFFFLWIAAIAQGAGGPAHSLTDATGAGLVVESAVERGRGLGLALREEDVSVGINVKEAGMWNLTTFDYRGIRWTPAILASRLAWILAACVMPLLAALWFDRFDEDRARAGARRGTPERAAGDAPPVVAAATSAGAAPAPAGRAVHAADLPPATRGFGILPLLRAEAAIQLRGRSRWWWLVAIGLAVTSALVPAGVGRGMVQGFAWIWPLFLWSSMGARERLHGTADLLFSAPRPIARQLASVWLVGVAIAGAAAFGVPLRALMEGNTAAALAWLGGAGFVSSFALACGVWSGTGKLFEVLYLLLWYVGPINQAPPLDYGGFTAAGLAAGTPFRFAAAGFVLLALAVAGRRRQIHSDRRG
ncbi:MAG TPA: hypothetical protein VFB49_00045 [Patescibacteria group bacterium]|nr:hypothetical protein [Patescibacteria group bacterium]